MEKTYDIAQAARFLGVPASTLRYWEDERLIRSQRDERNGYRRYALHDLMEAGEVAFYRKMGVSVGLLRGYRDFTAAQFDELLHAARISIDERLEELERMRRRVGFQLEMNERAPLLSDGRLRPGLPSMARLVEIDYDSERQWSLLVGDASKYAVLVDAGRPRELVEAVAEDAPCAASDGGGHGTGDGDVALPEGAQGASDARALLWRIEDAPEGAEWLECLFKCSFERDESNAVDLFDKARAMGLHPLGLVGRYLLTASDGARWDWYRCWLECVRG